MTYTQRERGVVVQPGRNETFVSFLVLIPCSQSLCCCCYCCSLSCHYQVPRFMPLKSAVNWQLLAKKRRMRGHWTSTQLGNIFLFNYWAPGSCFSWRPWTLFDLGCVSFQTSSDVSLLSRLETIGGGAAATGNGIVDESGMITKAEHVEMLAGPG